MTVRRTERVRCFSSSSAYKESTESKSNISFNPIRVKAPLGTRGLMKPAENGSHFWTQMTFWLPEKLEWQVRAVEEFKGKSCACVTDARLVDNLGMDTTAFRKSGKHYEETMGMYPEAVGNLVMHRDPFWVSSLLVRTDLVKQVGLFDPHIEYAEDHDLLFRLSLATSFCYVDKPLCILDRSSSPQGSTCRQWDQVEVRLRGSQLVYEKWVKLDSKLSPEVRKTLVQNLRHVHSAWTNWYLEHERYSEARQAISSAVKYELTPKLAIKWALTRVAPSFARRISPKMRVHE